MTTASSCPHEWDRATLMMPLGAPREPGPQGALIPDVADKSDQIAVVYNKGETPPRITITNVSRTVQAVMADGVAVAVVARADGPALSVEDILLVERTDGKASKRR
ncbi:hypothetical protein [Sulfitobacter sabulilitoris]|uniref:hypothetical protein n=1 Tax=Sulfitobacter sabulilitoris TaxID=2562655 RepID=UPI001BB095CA|nr:hypothetical protein [Sulfitobacter sabulilitoris]